MFDEKFLKEISQRDEILLERAFSTIKNDIIEKTKKNENYIFEI